MTTAAGEVGREIFVYLFHMRAIFTFIAAQKLKNFSLICNVCAFLIIASVT